MTVPRILIIGGSTRAAADSVRRAGCQPVCADLFADLDLRNSAEVVPVRHYPDSLPDDIAHVRADGWFYCGALENHPEILDRIQVARALDCPLLGTPPDAVRLVRNPQWLMTTLQSAAIQALAVVDQVQRPVADGTWLQKPLASAGGRSIRVWDEMATRIPFPEPHYFQQAVAGIGMSAICRVEPGDFELLGISTEFDSHLESRTPSRFSYCGSFGPWNPTDANRRPVQHQLTTIIKALLEQAPGLNGMIGLDFRLLDGDVWLTEVNPRYTASVEVLELATRRSLLDKVLASGLPSWRGNLTAGGAQVPRKPPQAVRMGYRPMDNRNLSVNMASQVPQESSAAHCDPLLVAKQILYANTQLTAPDLSRFLSHRGIWQIPIVADVPIPGTIVQPGWPICTVLAGGCDLEAVTGLLRTRVNMVWSILR